MTTFTTDDRLHAEKDGSFTIDCRPKPLTNQFIEKLYEKCWFEDGLTEEFDFNKFARAIEKAHGIG